MSAAEQPFVLLQNFVAERHASCAQGLFAERGCVYGPQQFGQLSFFPEALPLPADALFDLASLTKVMATTTAVLLLVDGGELRLDDPLQRFWPGTGGARQDLTLRHLLTHTAGFSPWEPMYEQISRRDEAAHWILQQPLKAAPGRFTAYSCLGFILLGLTVEKVVGTLLDKFLARELWEPLEMNSTLFNPDPSLRHRIPYTEWCPRRRQFLCGVVHDENAQAMAGVSGNAGLFSTIHDIEKFCRFILTEGRGPRGPLLSSAVVRLLWKNHTPGFSEARSLGWSAWDDRGCSGGDLLSASAIGHTGFTGTSLWIDPEQERFFIVLTNRVHPTRQNREIISLRPRFHNAAVSFLSRQ